MVTDNVRGGEGIGGGEEGEEENEGVEDGHWRLKRRTREARI
jgi:hypothetical protein